MDWGTRAVGDLVRGGSAIPLAMLFQQERQPESELPPVFGVDPSNPQLGVAALVVPSTAQLRQPLDPAGITPGSA